MHTRTLSASAGKGRALAGLLRGAWRQRSDPAGWRPDLQPLLTASGTRALAWRRVRHEPAAAGLRDAQRVQAAENAVRFEQARESVARLRAHGIEPLLAKGWAIARLYPEPGLRPVGDIDLFVPEADHVRAAELLADPPGPIDLHRGPGALASGSECLAWKRSVLLPAEEGGLRVPAAADHLRLIALHMLGHGAWRPLWLCDVALLAESAPNAVAELTSAPARSEQTPAVALALRLAVDLLGAEIGGVSEGAPPPRWLPRAVLTAWGRERFTPHGQRVPFSAHPGLPGKLHALLERWPNPIEATADLGGPWNEFPRWPFQLAACVRRTERWARSR